MRRAYSSASSSSGGSGGSVAGSNANFTWNKTTKLLTLTQSSLGTTTADSIKLENSTAATAGSQVQISPSVKWTARGWKTNSVAATQPVEFRSNVLPITGTTNPRGAWQLQYSVNSAAYTTGLEFFTTDTDGVVFPKLKVTGAIESSVNNSSTISTLQNVLLTNPSGSKTNIGFKFGSTIKAGIVVDASGYFEYRGLQHNFFTGSTAESAFQIVQIYGGGIYNAQASFNAAQVTAGSADTGATIRLSTYGGFAGKGVLTNTATYTFGDELVEYVDGDSAFECSGTATACATYVTQGTCDAHALAGCTWFAGNACSAFTGTNEGTCEGNAGCTWEETPCSPANNTDQTTCENQDDAYGGNCAWDTSTCPAILNEASCNGTTGCSWSDICSGFTDQGSCEGTSPCVWNFTDCSTSFFDESSCNAQSGCSWDGATCNGQFNTSCTGGLCSGNLCTGNYATGNCNGTYGAVCQGTASCGNLTDDGETLCELEAGCTWVAGATYTLPVSSIANRNNTSRFYIVKNIGAVANVNVVAGAGDTLESAVSLAPLDAVKLHHYTKTANCSTFVTSGTCTPSGCSWLPASCSDFGADEATCNAQSGNGCSWDGDSCEGTYSGTAGSCSGTYTISKTWYKLGSF